MSSADGWLGIELRHFAALRAVGEERSFSRAATRLGYTQSAVSQQVAQLERIVGERLVERPGGPRRVSLTEPGELLLRHAEAILGRLQAARADVTALAAGETGTLRIGSFQSAGRRLLPGALRRLRAEWPGVEVRLVEKLHDAELLQLLLEGELDVSFTPYPPGDERLEHAELLHDPFVLVVPADSPLASAPAVTPALLAGQRLVAYSSGGCQAVVERGLADRGIVLDVVFRSDDNAILQGAVGAGLGASILPRLALDGTDSSVAVLDLGALVPPRTVCVAWARGRYRSAAARAFVEIAQDCAAGLAGP